MEDYTTVKAISADVAEADVTRWLNHKKVFDSTRNEHKDKINLLIEGIQNGVLVINEDFTITHKLLHPLDGVTELTYRARINDNMLRDYYKGVANDDGDERLRAVIGCLTEKARGIIAKLDSLDKKLSIAIGIFFM